MVLTQKCAVSAPAGHPDEMGDDAEHEALMKSFIITLDPGQE